jgi:hypothetical protein
MNEWLPKFKGRQLIKEIEKSTAGLIYISESDAPIEAYSSARADAVNDKFFTDNTRVEETTPASFFSRLTADHEWYGTKEKEEARRFAELEKLLEENLRDLKVFKVGRIQIAIYVVGIDADNNLIGIKTKAVET